MTRLIREVRSGGQTGVDRAALDAAMANAIPYAGWIPRGRLAEDGTVPERYRLLQETPTEDYAERTAWNVRDADATLVLHFGALAGGTLLTAEYAARWEKPCLALDLDATPGPLALAAAQSWLGRLRCPVTLNVAGPRASSTPAGYARARAFLDQLFADGHAWPTDPGRSGPPRDGRRSPRP